MYLHNRSIVGCSLLCRHISIWWLRAHTLRRFDRFPFWYTCLIRGRLEQFAEKISFWLRPNSECLALVNISPPHKTHGIVLLLLHISCGWIFGKITDSRRQIEHSAPQAQSHTRAARISNGNPSIVYASDRIIAKRFWKTAGLQNVLAEFHESLAFTCFPMVFPRIRVVGVAAATSLRRCDFCFVYSNRAPNSFLGFFFHYLFLSMSASCSISSITHVQCVCVCARELRIRFGSQLTLITFRILSLILLLFFMFCSHAIELGWLSFLNLINSVLAVRIIRWPQRWWWAFFQFMQWCVARSIGDVVTKPVKYKQMLSVDLN